MDKGRYQNLSYILITAARNEETYIEKTIQSIIAQTILPERWVIVSDGSTDCTDEIINKYKLRHLWIEFIRLPEHRNRNFAAKVNCFNAGYQKIKYEKYEIIGNLDADISFERDYFEFLLTKFMEAPDLGVAGTPFVEPSHQYNYKFTNIEHVSGACQLFRRECFEEIGGYTPIEGGGLDWAAVTSARMIGWKTRTFTEKACIHHRKIGSNENNALISKFKHGQKDYYLGNHPIWEMFRAFYQMKSKPYLIGGLFLFAGYVESALRGVDKPVSKELIKFSRNEQIKRLKKIFSKA